MEASSILISLFVPFSNSDTTIFVPFSKNYDAKVKRGASHSNSLNFLSAAALITEFEAVSLHKFLGIVAKAESMTIDINGSGLSFHLVESRIFSLLIRTSVPSYT